MFSGETKWVNGARNGQRTLHFFRIKDIVLNKAKKNRKKNSEQENFKTNIPLSTSDLV